MATPNGNLVEGVIANLPLFKHSSKPHLAELARHARTQHVTRGTLIVHRGDKLQGLLAVAYGMVKLSLRGEAVLLEPDELRRQGGDAELRQCARVRTRGG